MALTLAFQIPGNEVGGNETALLPLLDHLAAVGHRVWLIAPPGPAHRYLAPRCAGTVSPATDLAGWRALLSTLRPDLLVVTLGHILGVGAAARSLGIPALWWDSLPACLLAPDNPARDLVLALFDHIVFQSRFGERQLGRAENVRRYVIPLGVDVERFHPVPEAARRSLLESLGIAPGSFVVGYAARYDMNKRHGDAVKAFAALHSIAPRAHLVLLGRTEGKYGRSLWESTRDLVGELAIASKVHFLCALPEAMPSLLSLMDVFCFPAIEENFGLALLEAMSVGIPVLAADSGGSGELIGGERAGRLFPPGDGEALGHLLKELYRNPRRAREMGESARALAVRRYSLPVMARAMTTIIESVAREARS